MIREENGETGVRFILQGRKDREKKQKEHGERGERVGREKGRRECKG